ncbi:MAG: glycoside hydrolase family 3 C-terminal domain-containing protein [Treponema sp.]|nr:glycoside hydrolase family 3 C-terminal domain-containing protein [Treponema sp.]
METSKYNLSVEEKIRLFNGDGNWNTFSAKGKLPVITMSDGPHGLRKQDISNYANINDSKIATCFPTASCIASSWNVNSAAVLGKSIGKEALKEKVNLLLGPGTNIKRSPLCGRNFEYFSEDPYLAGSMAASYINAMQEQGVGCSLKHFAANNQEKRRQVSNSIIDERTLHEIYLRAFEISVKTAQPESIMASYNRLNGLYVAHSKEILTDILRNKWGFKGFVVSDWGACIDTAACLKAGMDIAMPDSKGYFSYNLKKALADKIIQESDLDLANERIIKSAEKLKASEKENFTVDYKNQHQIALELAEDSAVLLKNENFFPLKKGSVCIIGKMAEEMKFQGGGSSHIKTAEYPNAIDSFTKLGFDVVYSETLSEAQINLIKNPEIPVLYFCGLTEKYEGEGFDRENLKFPEEQISELEKLLAISKNVALITFSGSPVLIPYADCVKGILHMYLCGEACGEAVAALVSGKISPSGKLAETFPLRIEDTPCFGHFAGEEDNVEYREGIFVGYRHYNSKNIPVLYDFGFGLSYTRFEYSNLKVLKSDNGDRVKLQVSISNKGEFAGSEIVQVYVKNPENPQRANKELRGFAKLFLMRGETKTVEILLDDNAFKIYSTKTHNFETVSGTYEIQVCASLNDVRLSSEISVEGKTFEELYEPVPENFWKAAAVPVHTKGSFTISDNLGDMANFSIIVKLFLKIMIFAVKRMNKGKSPDDPEVKISISAIRENPLESLISTSGGILGKKMAKFLVRRANR